VNEILIGSGTTVLGAVLSWWLTNFTARRSAVAADRAVTRLQADALIVAVYELRGLVVTNQVLWDGRSARYRTWLQAAITGGGEVARALLVSDERDRDGWLPALAGIGSAVGTIGSVRLASGQAAAAVTPLLTRIISAAAPLLRHSDSGVATATAALTTAVQGQVSEAALDDAVREFGRVVARSLEPRPRWWRRRLGSTPAALGQ